MLSLTSQDKDKVNSSPIYLSRQWTVPQLSTMIIYNGSWLKLIQWIKVILSGDKLT